MNSIEIIHAVGLKATSSRQYILDELLNISKPVTATELRAKLGSRAPDLATVYRTLNELVSLEIVKQIDFQHGHAHFEFIRENNHHHHLICKKCDKVEDIKEISLKIPKIKNFKVLDHNLEFYGICQNCHS